MKIFAQNNHCPCQVLFSFDETVDANVKQIRWAAAYSTHRGCERLVERVSARMGKSAWKKSPKQFVTALDFGLTEPDALEFLSSLPQSKVHIANADALNRPGFSPRKAYHPKLYLFDSDRASA